MSTCTTEVRRQPALRATAIRNRLAEIRRELRPVMDAKQAMNRAVVGAFAAAVMLGWDYATIADRLSCSHNSVKNWGSGRSLPRGDVLAEMLLGPALPVSARQAMWKVLAAEVGLRLVSEIDARADGQALQRQGLEVAGAVGALAADVAKATRADSPGGTLATAGELDQLAGDLDQVIQEASEMREAVAAERAKRAGGGA